MQFKDYWNGRNKKYSEQKISYDNWLNKHESLLDKCKTPVLDLGCGTGIDTLYLTKKGLRVVACDYSEVALEKVKETVPSAETKLVDISEPLPFSDCSFDLIIANLSLHYFDEQTTIRIMHEVKRILTPHGCLIAKVNSVNDKSYGAGQGKKIEENFYFVEGYNKRFFDFKDAKKFFSIIGEPEIKETNLTRYVNSSATESEASNFTKPKKVIEIIVEKPGK